MTPGNDNSQPPGAQASLSESVQLRGLAWDHPRSREPLMAVSADWSNGSGARVSWDARPRTDFERQPLGELVSGHDLVLIDPSLVGTAVNSGLTVPVEDWVEADFLADQARHSVGASYAAYSRDGRQWALPIDAECQVSAVREDLWYGAALGRMPSTWSEVAELAAERRKAPSRVALPLAASQAYSVFLAIGVSLAGTRFWPRGGSVDQVAGVEALHLLKNLAANLHPASRSDDSAGMSERMTRDEEILYVPLLFGCSSYARPGFRHRRLRFANAPRSSGGMIGSVLSGVGLALSACSMRLGQAADLARRIASAEVQSGLYARAGGQPAHGLAWASPEVNSLTGNFFEATQLTMNHAVLRPQLPGHRCFQPHAGELLHRYVWTNEMTARQCLGTYAYLIDTLLPEWMSTPGAGIGMPIRRTVA
jgi:multiple sugar transport system substrate-binding protein